jgi:mono/diheme cytochrome c family protein
MLLAITTTGKVVLLVVGGTFIAFSLLGSMVIPRRRPGFPGKDLPAFIAACVLLFGAQIAAVAWVTGTQEVEAKAAETPAPPETTPPPSSTAEGSEPGEATAGKAVFTGVSGCTNCHTLKDAGATGNVGPNLDDAKPPYSLVIDRVTHGKGVMPSFAGKLSKTDIENVAKYVSSVAGA